MQHKSHQIRKIKCFRFRRDNEEIYYRLAHRIGYSYSSARKIVYIRAITSLYEGLNYDKCREKLVKSPYEKY